MVTCDMQILNKKMRYESYTRLLLNDGTLVGYVDTIQEFPNILVPYTADTLDRRSRLRYVLDISTLQDQLILLRL